MWKQERSQTKRTFPFLQKYNPEAKFPINPKLIDQFIKGRSTPHDIQGLIDHFTKTVLERVLAGELTHLLGYQKNAKAKSGNSRNGTSSKTLKTKQGALDLEIPRDRNSSFEPQLVAKHQTRKGRALTISFFRFIRVA